MAQHNLRFKVSAPPSPHHHAAERFNQLQADLVSTARVWAMDEVSSAMAHQLNDPLTALLFHLHEIMDKDGHSSGLELTSHSMRETVQKALSETERVCDIMERMGHAQDTAPDGETTLASGRDAIESLTRGGHTNGNGNGHGSSHANHSSQALLTPREREVLALITEGASNKEGGHRLGISTRTFEVHRAHVMEKFGARNAADLVRMALSENR